MNNKLLAGLVIGLFLASIGTALAGKPGGDKRATEGKGNTCFDGQVIDLNLCKSSKDCTAVGGFWWRSDKYCSSCNSNNVNLCTAEYDCNAAGGFWSDNTCYSDPADNTSVSVRRHGMAHLTI
jgi:hypothetical protein